MLCLFCQLRQSSPSLTTVCSLPQLSRRTSLSSTEKLQGLCGALEGSNRASTLRCAHTELPISSSIHVLRPHVPPAESLVLPSLILKSHVSNRHNSTCFHLGGIRCNCSWFSTPPLRRGGTGAVCTCMCLVPSNTGLGNLHAHPLACVDSQLIP